MSGPSLLGRCEQLADVIKKSRIGREVRPWRSANRLLVHHDQPPDFVEAFRDLAASRLYSPVQSILVIADLFDLPHCVGDDFDQKLADQARLPRARNSSDACENAQRNINVQMVEVVASDPPKFQPAAAGMPGRGPGDLLVLREQVAPRMRLVHLFESRQSAAI